MTNNKTKWIINNRQLNCRDILLKYGNFREQKNPHPSAVPSIQSWHNTAWRGWRGGAIFPLFEVSKTLKKKPVKGEVSQLILLPTEYLHGSKPQAF